MFFINYAAKVRENARISKIYVFKHAKKIASLAKNSYLCNSYPEYNLFTLRWTNTLNDERPAL